MGGEGLIEWKVLDTFGHKCTINLKGYHIPTESVHLLGPHCVFQIFKGSHGRQDGENYVMILLNGLMLDAQFGSDNLSLLLLNDLS